MKKLLGNTALVLVSVLVMAAAFEIACRTVVNTGLQYDIEMWKYAVVLKRIAADPAVGHEHIPGTSAHLMRSDVTINGGGLRNREVAPEKPAGATRIMMLGDSIVFGWGVDQDKTMSADLDRLMHHCHLLEFDGRSYRLKQAAETLARETKSN